VRKIAALLWLDRLDFAPGVCEHAAGSIAIFGINEGKTSAISLQSAVLIDEFFLAQAEIGCDGGDILIRQADISLPAAACAAALACMDDG